MLKKELVIGEAIRFGWRQTLSHFAFWFGLFVIIFGISAFLRGMEYFAKEISWVLYANLAIIGAAFQTIVNAGFIALGLKYCDGQKPTYEDFLVSPQTIGRFVLAYLLYSLIVLAGFLLLIIPGIIWAMKYFPTVYLVIDKNQKPLNALRDSARLTEGVKGKLFIFFFLLLVINLLGVLALFLGLFVTVPMTIIANAFVYRHLLEHAPARAKLQPGVSPYAQKTSL